MTTELEQEFYDTFDIEPEYKTCIFKYCKNKKEYDCDNCGDRLWHYPEITAEKLLAMICILNNYGKYDCWAVTVARLKDKILENCIAVVICKLLNDTILERYKCQIQRLFKD